MEPWNCGESRELWEIPELCGDGTSELQVVGCAGELWSEAQFKAGTAPCRTLELCGGIEEL